MSNTLDALLASELEIVNELNKVGEARTNFMEEHAKRMHELNTVIDRCMAAQDKPIPVLEHITHNSNAAAFEEMSKTLADLLKD